MKQYLLFLIIPFSFLPLVSCAEPPATKINRCYYQVGDHIEFWRKWYDPQFKKHHITKSKLNGSDPSSFTVIDHPFSTTCYAKDKKQVYRFFHVIKGADPATFSFLGEFYARDKNKVFHRAKRLLQADPESFQVFDFTHQHKKFARVVVDAKDKSGLYNNGYRQKFSNKVDIASFTPINRYYFRDANHVYYGRDPGKPVDEDLIIIKGADPSTFILLKSAGGYYAKDHKHVYFNAYGKKFVVFTPKNLDTFEVLNVRYSKDSQAVYFNGRPLEGADPGSFEVLGDHRGKDKYNSWSPVGKKEKSQ